MDRSKIIKHLSETNEYDYNLLKTVEELTELSEVLMKRVLKGERAASNKAIIEEIGDVYIRLNIISKIFGNAECDDRIEQKLSKYEEYINEGKYIGKI